MNESMDDKLGHRLDGNVKAPLARVFGQQRSIRCVHAGHHRGLVVLQLGIIRKLLGVVPHEPGNACNPDDEHRRAGREQQAQEAQQQFHRWCPARIEPA